MGMFVVLSVLPTNTTWMTFVLLFVRIRTISTATCVSAAPLSVQSALTLLRQYCVLSAQDNLLLDNGTCIESCRLGSTNYQDECIDELASSVDSLHAVGKATSILILVGAAASLISHAATTGTSSMLYQSMSLFALLSYFRFFNINYPGHINLFFHYLKPPVLYFPNFLKMIISPDEASELVPALQNTHYKYEEQNVSTLFLEEYGSNISLMLVLIPCWLFAFILTKLHSVDIFKSIRNLLEWNLFITLILSYMVQQVSAMLLQFSHISSNGAYSVLGLCMTAVFCVILSAIVGSVALTRNRKNWQFISTKCKVLVEDLDPPSSTKKATPIYIILRCIIFVKAVFFLSFAPIAQACTGVLICFWFAILSLKKRIFKNKQQTNVMRFLEYLICINTLLVLFYAADDEAGLASRKLRFGVGCAFISVKIIVVAGLVLFQLSEMVRAVWNLFHSKKSKENEVQNFKIASNKVSDLKFASLPSPDASAFSMLKSPTSKTGIVRGSELETARPLALSLQGKADTVTSPVKEKSRIDLHLNDDENNDISPSLRPMRLRRFTENNMERRTARSPSKFLKITPSVLSD